MNTHSGHQRLKHLAQEHMAAMRLVVAARQAMPENEDDLPILVQRICTAFDTDMEPHFHEEEAVVLPKLCQAGLNELAERTLEEHQIMRGLIKTMRENPSVELLRQFSNMLRDHIHFENNIVWSALEKELEEN